MSAGGQQVNLVKEILKVRMDRLAVSVMKILEGNLNALQI